MYVPTLVASYPSLDLVLYDDGHYARLHSPSTQTDLLRVVLDTDSIHGKRSKLAGDRIRLLRTILELAAGNVEANLTRLRATIAILVETL